MTKSRGIYAQRHFLRVEGNRGYCVDCETWKPVERFTFTDSRADGHRRPYCNSCHWQRRKFASEKRRQERRSVIDQIKVSRGCIDCGYNHNPVALDFDHPLGVEKKYVDPRRIGTAPWDLILAEIEKCDVRCANCHRIITHERRHTVRVKKRLVSEE